MHHLQQEGYIKYTIHWKEKPIPVSADMSQLLYYRNALQKLHFIGAYPDGIGFGNISCKAEKNNSFFISGSQTGHVRVADRTHLCLVTKADIGTNTIHCEGPVKASSESLTHAAFYQADKNIRAVVHVHNLLLWENLMGIVPTTEMHIDYGTPAMANEVIRLVTQQALFPKGIIVTAGHKEGIFTFGNSFQEAYNILMYHFDQIKTG
ncbi:MAG: class II aldolase/adducin family protein [Chitinophagales bacterium]|nr:class II aldolase/adducin family protein [Chitinophagales bacterium]